MQNMKKKNLCKMLECQMELNGGKSSRGGNFRSNNFGGALSSPSTLLWPCAAFRFSECPFPQVHLRQASLLPCDTPGPGRLQSVTQWGKPDPESWPSAFAVAVLGFSFIQPESTAYFPSYPLLGFPQSLPRARSSVLLPLEF